MAQSNHIFLQDPKEKLKKLEQSDIGLKVFVQLFTSGCYEIIVEKILKCLDGVDLMALQMVNNNMDAFIKVHISNILIIASYKFKFCLKENFWKNSRKQQRLQNHWNIWFPQRTRLELNTLITCLAHNNLKLFCGMKNGTILVYDQNLQLVHTLGEF